MELKFKYLLYCGVFTFVLLTVEAVTCNKETIKYMLVQVCGYGYKKRSNTDQYFQVMSHEDVNKRFKDMVNSQLIILSEPSRHVLGMDNGPKPKESFIMSRKGQTYPYKIEEKSFSPRVTNPLKYNETTEDIQQELRTNGRSRSRKLQKRNVINPRPNKPGEKTGDTAMIKKYNGNIDDLMAGIVSNDDDDNKATKVHNGQSLMEKCCNGLCTLDDFSGFCS